MQISMRVNEQTYNLVKAEAKQRGVTMSSLLDELVVAALELDIETRALPSKKPTAQRPLPGGGPALQAQIDAIVKNDREKNTSPAETAAEVRYNIIVAMTGYVVRENLSEYEAEDYLREHNPDGDLSMKARA